MHSAITFYISMPLLVSTPCRFTKPFQFLNRIKGKDQRHIRPLNLWPAVDKDDPLHASQLHIASYSCLFSLLFHSFTPHPFFQQIRVYHSVPSMKRALP